MLLHRWTIIATSKPVKIIQKCREMNLKKPVRFKDKTLRDVFPLFNSYERVCLSTSIMEYSSKVPMVHIFESCHVVTLFVEAFLYDHIMQGATSAMTLASMSHFLYQRSTGDAVYTLEHVQLASNAPCLHRLIAPSDRVRKIVVINQWVC